MENPSVGHLMRWLQFDLPDEDTPEAGEVRAQQMASFARQTPINTTVTMAISLWLAVVLWPSAPQATVLGWAGLTWAVAVWHLARWWRRRDMPRPKQVSKAGPRKATFRAAAAGALWGATILFYPDVPVTDQMFLVITTGAMVAGASTTLGAIPMAASAFAICGVIPWVGLFVLHGDPDYVVLSIMAVIFLLAMLGSSRMVYLGFLGNVRAKQANAALLAQFHAERDEWFEISDTSQAFALFDAEDRLLLWNGNYERILSLPEGSLYRGAERAGILRRAAVPADVQDGRISLDDWIDRHLGLHETPDASVIQQLSNGRWLRSSARRTSRGRAVTLYMDITELKDRETALRRSEEKFRNLLEGSIQGVFIHRNWQPLFVNQALADMLGYDGPEDLLALDSMSRIVAPEDYPRLKAYRKARMRGEAAPVRHTARYQRKDGSIVWLEAVNSSADWDGAPAIQSVCIDVTDRIQAEQAQRASERRFQDFAEASADWFWETDADLRFTYISPNVERIAGVPPEWHYGKTREDMAANDFDRAALGQHLQTLREHRPFRDFVYSRDSAGGGQHWLRTSGIPLFAEDGSFLGYRGAGSDVTAQVQAEEALREREVRLRELQAELFHVSRSGAMGHLSSALAHELNQPLAAIMNYAQAGRRMLEPGGSGGPEKVHEMLNKTIDQAGRAGDVIHRLRDLFEKGETQPAPQSINEVVEDAASLALVDAARMGVEYKLSLRENLPTVIIDRIQIQQVVLNLVRNAFEAVAASRRRELTIETAITGDDVIEVSVCDTGPGLPPEVAKRLFEPFVTDKREGMGMGLSISRRIVTAHGGRLWTEPNPDGGACFRFTLPTAASVAEDQDG
jgi:PAS domain S-box-containing protein